MPKAKVPSKMPVIQSEFIRSQPATLSADEVVAKAKSEGFKIDRNLVYKVRSRLIANGKLSRNTKKSKADFVRAHPNLPPKEIVAKAKAEGVKFGIGYVYNVRGYDKTVGKRKVAAKKGASKSVATNGSRSSSPSTLGAKAENVLRAVAAEIGLGRAIEILAGERARVRAVIEG
jgi:hypothetical protein